MTFVTQRAELSTAEQPSETTGSTRVHITNTERGGREQNESSVWQSLSSTQKHRGKKERTLNWALETKDQEKNVAENIVAVIVMMAITL